MGVLLDKAEVESSNSNRWYTPQVYIDSARKVLGFIDLDPASDEYSNRVVKAASIFTEEDSGLEQEWYGSVWLNPPFNKIFHAGKWDSGQGLWSLKLIHEYESGRVAEAIILVQANTSEGWFLRLWKYPICVMDHRIRFYSQGWATSSPTKGGVFVYFGENSTRFEQEFSKYGPIVRCSVPGTSARFRRFNAAT